MVDRYSKDHLMELDLSSFVRQKRKERRRRVNIRNRSKSMVKSEWMSVSV